MFIDGKNAYRGCSSEPGLGKTYCNQHVHQCVECSENGCNDKSLEWSKEKLSCIKCKSIDGKKCNEIDDDFAAEECAPVAEGYDSECYTYTGIEGVERGCLYEASGNVQRKSCTLCKDSRCNHVAAVPTVHVEFYNENIKVEAPVKQSNVVQPKIGYAGKMEPGKPFDKKPRKYPKDSCFTYINKDKAIKGCKL